MDISGRGKPFENIYQQPTVSPYLALDLLNDEGTGLTIRVQKQYARGG